MALLGTKHVDFKYENNSTPGVLTEEIQYIHTYNTYTHTYIASYITCLASYSLKSFRDLGIYSIGGNFQRNKFLRTSLLYNSYYSLVKYNCEQSSYGVMEGNCILMVNK